mgnify:CR=1 FL=1
MHDKNIQITNAALLYLRAKNCIKHIEDTKTENYEVISSFKLIQNQEHPCNEKK